MGQRNPPATKPSPITEARSNHFLNRYRFEKTNPKAAYLFKEKGDQYQGKRLFLTKIREEPEDESELRSRRRKCYDEMGLDQGSGSFVVYFRVDKVVPLVGIG